ncbi:MAG: hypothetical protein Q7R40_01230, partial [Phaeospirillum sp.]|nr:hypothetical protein [Phaeospirillum sp.]
MSDATGVDMRHELMDHGGPVVAVTATEAWSVIEMETLSCGHPWSERAGGPLAWYCRACVAEANQRDWLTAAEAAFEVLDDAIPWEVGQIQLHAYRIHSDARTANDFIDALRAWFMDRGEHWICGVFP